MSKYVINLLPESLFTLLDWLQLIYDDQIERLKEKEQKDAKKRQRLGENFSDLLYSITVLQLTVNIFIIFLAIAYICMVQLSWATKVAIIKLKKCWRLHSRGLASYDAFHSDCQPNLSVIYWLNVALKCMW